MLVLRTGPDHPRHVIVDEDGIAYVRDPVCVAEQAPARFRGPARPEDAEGPPWATLVFGLETGAHDMRARFLAALRADADAGRSLVRYGDALEAAFRRVFGGRGATPDAPGFLEFVRTAHAAATRPEEREQLARGLRDFEAIPMDERIERAGARAVAFGVETGHVPADHPEVLYWLSALVPGWRAVSFDQEVTCDDDEDESSARYELVAWCRGQAIRSAARNLGDYVDAWSCAGLVNVLLRDVVESDVRVFLQCEDEGALAVAAPVAVLQQLRGAGVLGSDDDDECDDDED